MEASAVIEPPFCALPMAREMYVADGGGFHKRRYFRAVRPCAIGLWCLIYSDRKKGDELRNARYICESDFHIIYLDLTSILIILTITKLKWFSSGKYFK